MITLENYIGNNYIFNTLEIEKIINCFERKTLDKNGFFLKEGQYCKSIAFVESGIFLYYTVKDGEEKVCDFAF
ncbi:hypothetical protein NF867_06980 [Solitalea sp. MAHUQ-68]|uniref:Crp/Fnr family transcriptional regulator n=1 Tax=Solitalea agri TaxID=2953739 RepID=A0A9X2JC20_9SPHI|nr:hypothetical protein [Solitalea agri]MCO4292598.1 hypothetical protein [Solitalea agri]